MARHQQRQVTATPTKYEVRRVSAAKAMGRVQNHLPPLEETVSPVEVQSTDTVVKEIVSEKPSLPLGQANTSPH